MRKKLHDFIHWSKNWGKQNYFLVLGIVVTIGYFYSELLFGDYKFSFTNIMYNFLPFKILGVSIKGPLLSDVADNMLPILYRYVHQFNFTFWAPNIGIGAPQSMNYYFSVFKYIYILPFDYAIFIVSMIKYVIAFMGMYFLCKEYGLEKFSRFSAGIAYTFSSSMVAWNGWPHTEVAMLAPFLFLVTEKYIKSLNIVHLFQMVVVLTMMFFAGMPTYVAYFLYLLGAYVLVKGLKYYRSDLKKLSILFLGLGIAVLCSTLLSLPYTGELLNSVGANGYMDSRRSQVYKILNLRYLNTLLFPYIRNGMDTHFNESTLYTGIAAIFLLPLTLINWRKKKKSMFWVFSVLILLILVFSNLLTPLYSKLPLVNSSLKYRVIILFNFSTSIIIGINLNDVICHAKNYIQAKKEYFTLFILISIFIAYVLYRTSNSIQLNLDSKIYIAKALIILLSIFLIITGLIYLKRKKIRNILLALFCLFMILDMGGFAKNYLPMIKDGNPSIPNRTDTLKFLEKNTQSQEKVAVLGEWTLFPNSNLFYNIRDIRMHDFVATNEDIHSYYSAIDPNSYTSATRISFNQIKNRNLLKYMGVKYIVSPEPTYFNLMYSNSTLSTVGAIHDDIRIEQEFVSEKDGLTQLKILTATYENIFSDETLLVEILDSNKNDVLRSIKIPLKNIQDNHYLDIKFNRIDDSKGKNYIIRLTTDVQAPKAITAYRTLENKYDGELRDNNGVIDGNMIFYPLYNSGEGFIGVDDLIVEKVENFSNQFELIDKVEIVSDSDSVLKTMEKEYEKNQVVLTKDQFELSGFSLSAITSENKLKNKERIIVNNLERNGNAEITTITSQPRILIMNEYYDENWKAYVDGKETNLVKANYLFRAIEVPKGRHRIEFKYVPIFTYKMFSISGITLIFLVLLFIFRKKLQLVIRTYLGN